MLNNGLKTQSGTGRLFSFSVLGGISIDHILALHGDYELRRSFIYQKGGISGALSLELV
jgi:hypothetical protein